MLWAIDNSQKVTRWPVSHDCIAGSSVQVIEVACFFKLSTDQLLVLIDRRLNYFRVFYINSTKKAANNLLISSIRSLQGFPCNDLTPSL